MARKKPKLENLKSPAYEDTQYLGSDSSDEDPWRYFIQMPLEGKRMIRRLDSNGNQVKMASQGGSHEISNDADGFMCHICNVFVQRRFAKDHSESKKHESYKKLTKTIVQNVIKQQNASITYNNNERNEPRGNSTYCGPCSKPVPPADKLKHRISKDHLKAVENETVFNNFLEMFFDTHPDGTESENNETIVDLDKILAVKGLDVVDGVAPTVSIKQTNLFKNNKINNNKTPPTNANLLQVKSTSSITKSHKNIEVNNNNETTPTSGTQSTSYLTVNESQKINKVHTNIQKNIEVSNNNETTPTNGTQSTSYLTVNESQKINKVHTKSNKNIEVNNNNETPPTNANRSSSSLTKSHKNIKVNNKNETSPTNGTQSTSYLTVNESQEMNKVHTKSHKNIEVNNNNETTPTSGAQSTSYLKVNESDNESQKIQKVPKIDEVKSNMPSVIEKEIMELKQYINDINEQYDVKLKEQFKVDDSLSVIARSPNGEKIKISVDSFHSYIYGVNFVNCQLCKLLIDPEAKAKHSTTLRHMQFVSVPLNNKFCREINNLWCHDVRRNEMALIEARLTPTPINSNDSNNNTMNSSRVVESTKVSNKNKKIKYCDVCDLPIHINNFVEHVKGRKHVLNEKKNKRKTLKDETDNQGKNIKIEADNVNIKMEPENMTNKMEPFRFNFERPTNEAENIKDMTLNSMDISQFLQYLRDMVAKFNLNYKLPAVENNCVVMITPRGYKENVTVDTFHSYKQVETGLYCQVCQLPLSGNVKEHSVSRTHVRNITLPVDDNFARRISKAWSHCLICNLMVLVGYQHAMTNPAHKNHNPIHESKTTAVHNNLDENLREYCDICDRNMLKRDYAAHVSGKQHIKNINIKTAIKKTTTTYDKTPNTVQKEIKTRESDFETYLKEMTMKYKLHCKLPTVKDNGVIIVTPSGCTEKFTVNTFHSYKQAEDAIFCQMCQLWIRNDVKAHSMEKTHVSLIMQPVDDNFARLINKTWSHCLVCNIMIQNDNNHASSSSSHNKYKKLTKPTQQPQNISNQFKKPEDTAQKTYCDACQTYIHTHNFISHTAGRKHKDNANKKEKIKKVYNTVDGISYTKKYADNSSNVATENAVKVNNKTENAVKINNMKDVNVNPNNIKIESVQTNVQKSNINLDSNVNTKCIIIIAPNGCDAMATEDGFHSYKRIRSFIYCQVCSKWMSQEDAAHSVSKSHIKHIMQPIDNEFIRQVNPTWQHCLICNEMIPTDTTHEHTPELTRQDVITTNYAIIRKTMCYPCFEYIHTCSFSAHIQTQKHITKLRKSIEKIKNKSSSQVVTVKNEASSNNTIFKDIANLELYFKTIITKYDLKLNTPIVENNSIVIQTPKGHKESIDVDSFHSYKRTPLSIFCQICQVSVSHDEYEHSVTETHARHVVKPVDDNFARAINQAWRHCMLCNEMIFTGFDHVTNNSKHDKFTKPSTSRNYNININSNQVKTENFNTNIKVKEETMEMTPTICKIETLNENFIKKEDKIRKDVNEINMSLNDKNNSIIQDTNTSVKIHNESFKEDTHTLLNNNKIRKTSSGLFNCRLCCIDVEDFLIHINENLEHIKAKILDDGVKKTELIRYVYDEESLDDPVSTAYKQIYEDLLVENKIKRMSKLIFSCKRCTLWITRGNEINHIFSNEHKLNN